MGDCVLLERVSPNLLKLFSAAKFGVGGARLSFSSALENEDLNTGDESRPIAEGLRGSRTEKLVALLFKDVAYMASLDIGIEDELPVFGPGLVKDRATGGGANTSFSFKLLG